MATIGQFLGELLKRAGVDVMQPQYADVLSLTGSIPDDAANAVMQNLVSADSAKTNPDLKRYYFAQAYDGIDQTLKDQMAKHEFDEDSVNQLSAEKSTGKRVGLFADKLAQKYTGKVEQATQQGAQQSQGKIDELSGQLTGLQQKYDTDLADVKTRANTTIANTHLKSMVKTKPLAVDLDSQTIINMITKKLEELGAIITVLDDGELQLVSIADGTPWEGAEDKTSSVDDMVAKVLADSKLLKVSGGSAKAPKAQPGEATANPAAVTTKPAANSKYIADLQASIKADQQ